MQEDLWPSVLRRSHNGDTCLCVKAVAASRKVGNIPKEMSPQPVRVQGKYDFRKVDRYAERWHKFEERTRLISGSIVTG